MPNPKSTIKSYPQRLAVEHVSLDLIDPNERNSRKHRMRKIRDLALNIEQTRGLNNPLAVRSKGNGRFELIAGHARRAALLMNGETVAPVIRLDHLSPAEARAYARALLPEA